MTDCSFKPTHRGHHLGLQGSGTVVSNAENGGHVAGKSCVHPAEPLTAQAMPPRLSRKDNQP